MILIAFAFPIIMTWWNDLNLSPSKSFSSDELLLPSVLPKPPITELSAIIEDAFAEQREEISN